MTEKDLKDGFATYLETMYGQTALKLSPAHLQEIEAAFLAGISGASISLSAVNNIAVAKIMAIETLTSTIGITLKFKKF